MNALLLKESRLLRDALLGMRMRSTTWRLTEFPLSSGLFSRPRGMSRRPNITRFQKQSLIGQLRMLTRVLSSWNAAIRPRVRIPASLTRLRARTLILSGQRRISHPSRLTWIVFSIKLLNGLLKLLAASFPQGICCFEKVVTELSSYLSSIPFPGRSSTVTMRAVFLPHPRRKVSFPSPIRFSVPLATIGDVCCLICSCSGFLPRFSVSLI